MESGDLQTLRSSGLKAVGLLFAAVLVIGLLGDGQGWLVVAAVIGAAVVTALRTESGAVELTSVTVIVYTTGIVWLVHEWSAAFWLWTGIGVLVLATCVASFRSDSGRAKAICVLMLAGLPQALWAALFVEFWSKNWTLF